MLRLFKKAVRGYLDRRGLCLIAKHEIRNLHAAMTRWPRPAPRTVIDVGASDGRWSAEVLKHYPEANYLLIEAQGAAHGAGLRRLRAAHPNVDYVIAAAGGRDGEIHFDASAPFGGQASETPFASHSLVVPMVRVDTLVRARALPGPYLLKLDTHGFEVPILEGAAETLRQTGLLIVEAYNFTLCPGCLRFHELCAWLEARGFRCVDLFDLMHRPGDGAFWQMDLVFAPAAHPVFTSNRYA